MGCRPQKKRAGEAARHRYLSRSAFALALSARSASTCLMHASRDRKKSISLAGYALGTLTVMDFEPRKLAFEHTVTPAG
jgi:hypothetical protein